jgi:hypothetical protein
LLNKYLIPGGPFWIEGAEKFVSIPAIHSKDLGVEYGMFFTRMVSPAGWVRKVATPPLVE